MKIAIVAGGTLGHIVPGMILSKELSKKHDVIYITSKKDSRFNIFEDSSFLKKTYFIEACGIKKTLFKNIKPIYINIKASHNIRKILKEERVDLLIGMGGFISGIAMLVASNKVKKIIHEQNKVMGLANKIALDKVDKILLTFDIDLKSKFKKKVKVVSNPCLFTSSNTQVKNRNNILITSGSNGAKQINDLAIKIINENSFANYHITLITGSKYYDEVISKVKSNSNVDIYPFVDNMSELMEKSSFVICRAGSSTIFEALSNNTVPLLFPSSNVTNNHQYFNALEITKLGMGEIIDNDTLVKMFYRVNNNYNEYIKNIKRYKKHYSLENIMNTIEEVIVSKE